MYVLVLYHPYAAIQCILLPLIVMLMDNVVVVCWLRLFVRLFVRLLFFLCNFIKIYYILLLFFFFHMYRISCINNCLIKGSID